MHRRNGYARRTVAMVCAVAVVAGCSSDAGVRSGPSADSRAGTLPTSTAAPGSSTTTPDGQPGSTVVPPTVPTPAADGVGDELFPSLGFTGIDVQHYDVVLSYDPSADTIAGSVAIDLQATAPLEVFSLDAVGLEVERVSIDGTDVAFEVGRDALVVQPARPLNVGESAQVEVLYNAAPDAGAGVVGIPNGWFHSTGGSYVLNEPDGARTWMPCNDHPSDKATFTFDLTVPAGMAAVANGDFVSHDSSSAGERWVWAEAEPMATYLILLLTGDYVVSEATTSGGLPLINVTLSGDEDLLDEYVRITDEQLAFFEPFFGPYPLDRYGLAITDSFGGLAMETQGRSLFSRDDMVGQQGYIEHLLLAHELAHQWYGNAVTPARWIDIWLNESFATYAQWMWLEHVGFGTVDEFALDALRARVPGATGRPAAGDMFSFSTYDGGATVLHALRLTVGDDAFFDLLRGWVQDHIGQSKSTLDFIAFAQQVTGTDLAAFFDDWLFSENKPDDFP